jgi:hypothetical protein
LLKRENEIFPAKEVPFLRKTRYTIWTASGIASLFKVFEPDTFTRNNCIEDWGSKIDAVVDFLENRLISGIPNLRSVYFERLEQKGGK